MKKIGLALSGGGFRATLYHLGLIRFLRDAGLLPNVNVITAVSGGSIFAAHLGLNWGRYSGSPNEFDAAAAEILNFVRLDVRNRIVRRYPFGYGVRWARWLAGRSNRRLTLPGLLEYHYEQYLYGDTSLFQLPEHPRLHLLSTNLSEGCLCSFNRDGLWMVRREAERAFRMDRLPIGLATVPMAVTASSAFPGFFPPLVLTGDDVGAKHGEFGVQAYTDGGVFDNLGVRMFRFLAQHETPDRPTWDGVLVSDVGKRFEVHTDGGASGLIRTSMRASEILMDRVWQLENERFHEAPGFAFARITDLVTPEQDPTAPNVEIQRQLPGLRTDFDRFSPIEISYLVRQGYCVGRKTCRAHPELFGTDLPSDPPWDPMPTTRATTTSIHAAAGAVRPGCEAAAVTQDARVLHNGAVRRIWSTLLDPRDWVSHIYVPILVPILLLTPYFATRFYQRSVRLNQIMESLAQGSKDVEQMTRLMEGPVPPFTGDRAEELPPDSKLNPKGFLILQDLRMIDLRQWTGASGQNEKNSLVYGYRRLKVRKEIDNKDNNTFRVSVLAVSPDTQVRFPAQELNPKLYSRTVSDAGGERQVHWEIGADFRKVPPGDTVDVIYEHTSPGKFLRNASGGTSLTFDVEVETVELTRWLLLPEGKEYRTFQMIRYPIGKPEAAENVELVTRFLAEDSSILAFKLLALKPGYTYEMTWLYR